MYLQPIFDSDDIMRQLPTEGAGGYMILSFSEMSRQAL